MVTLEHTTRKSSLLVTLQPNGSQPPFFCVHGVGGTATAFARLAHHTGEAQPFIAIRARGSDDDGPPIDRIETMAATYLEEIRRQQPHGPYFLGGFSFGGSVALEMAQQLTTTGECVALLAILDHMPPPFRFRRFTWTPRLLVDFPVNAARWCAEELWQRGKGNRIGNAGRMVQKATKLVGDVVKRRRSESGDTDVVDVFQGQVLPDRFRQLLAVHFQAMRDYVPRPYPNPITLLRARTRPLLRLHGHDLGWRSVAQGELAITTVPGNHETMLTEPAVAATGRRLRACLETARHRAAAARRT